MNDKLVYLKSHNRRDKERCTYSLHSGLHIAKLSSSLGVELWETTKHYNDDLNSVCYISKSDYHRELNTDGTVGFIKMNCSRAYKASDRLSFLRATRGERKIILCKLG